MKRKFAPDEIALLITSILFFVGIFLNKWIFLIFTTIWLITVCFCIYNMIKMRSGGIGEFLNEADTMSAKHLKEGKLIRGGIEAAIIPIFALVVFGIICCILWLILL